MASQTQNHEARVVELEGEMTALKQQRDGQNRLYEAQIKELEAKVEMLTAQTERLVYSGAPLVPLTPLAGDKVNSHGILVAGDTKGQVYAYHRQMRFDRDPGYSFDALRGRAAEAASYAFGGDLLGDPNAYDQRDRYKNLPTFSPKSCLNVLVWVAYAPQSD
jgi:hypothetical protein